MGKKIKVYFYGKNQAEAKEQCNNLLSILDPEEIKSIPTVCVFDFRNDQSCRCYSVIEINWNKLKGEV